MRWYLTEFGLLEDDRFCKPILQYLHSFCQKGENSREGLLNFYETNADVLNPVFAKYPEYDFIVHGKYQRYEMVSSIANKLEITMQEYAIILRLFKKTGNRPPAGSGTKSRQRRYIMTAKQHREAVLATIDHVNNILIHLPLETAVFNIWPNELKGRLVAKEVGPYIGLAFHYKAKWWILVDSTRRESAIYLWSGDNQRTGLDIFTESRTYARTRKDVFSKNHTPALCSYFESYRKLFRRAGCGELLE
jgi:hypothetical protein